MKYIIFIFIINIFLYFLADMVQHHFISMRQTFMTNLRKEHELKNNNGKSSEEIYKSKWIL